MPKDKSTPTKIKRKNIKKDTAWVIIFNKKQEVLLIRRSKKVRNPGQYNFPGGTVDPGENPLTAAKREFKEETKATCPSLKAITTLDGPRGRRFVFTNTKLLKDKIKLTEESDKIVWAKFENLKKIKKLHATTQAIYKYVYSDKKSPKQINFVTTAGQQGLFMYIEGHDPEDNAIVASAMISVPSKKLYNVIVEPKYRGNGYSTQMMAYIMQQPFAPRKLEARPDPDSTLTAQDLAKFYGRYGFIPTPLQILQSNLQTANAIAMYRPEQ